MARITHRIGLMLLATVFAILFSENQVSGQCCHATPAKWNGQRASFGGGRCGDDTRPTPCCGVRSCNIFCCNCSDGGCRGRRWTRDVSGKQPEEHQHDKNKDGHYDLEEVHNLILSGACGNYTEKIEKWEKEFKRMDKDKDGKLSYEEING